MARRSHHGRHPGRHRRPHRPEAPRPGGDRPPAEPPASDRTASHPGTVADDPVVAEAPPSPAAAAGVAPDPVHAPVHVVSGDEAASAAADDRPSPVGPGQGATASQLRRFIRSRPYVPMHELRRRFALNGGADEMVAVEVDGQRLWVGLPAREGRLLGDLLRGGDIGYEISVDPVTPVIVGVYALRSSHSHRNGS